VAKRPEGETAVLDGPEISVREGSSAISPKLIVPLGRGSRGKTAFVRWAAERAQSHGREVVIADMDRTNPTLSGFFGGVTQPEEVGDVDVREWLAAFVEGQIENRFSAFLDLGGGDLILKQVARDMDLVPFLERHGIQPVAVHVLGPDRDDLAYLRDMEQAGVFAPAATILVLNEALVPANRSVKPAFETLVQHEIFRAALGRGAKAVWMPRLAAMHEVDNRRLTFSDAEGGKVKEGQAPIGPWNRQVVAKWRRDMEAAFADVAHLLP